MADFKKYGVARWCWGGVRKRTFNGSLDALAWYEKMTKGLCARLFSSVMVYNDAECTDPMLRGFDMCGFQCDADKFGFHNAYDWANEGKYGYEGMPEILKRPANGNKEEL